MEVLVAHSGAEVGGGWVLMVQEEEEVCNGKGEGEISGGGFCRRRGDGLIEGVVLWLFTAVPGW